MKWIAIKDKKPPKDVDVLGVRVERGKNLRDGKPYIHLSFDVVEYDGKECLGTDEGVPMTITHWTPITPPTLNQVMEVEETDLRKKHGWPKGDEA